MWILLNLLTFQCQIYKINIQLLTTSNTACEKTFGSFSQIVIHHPTYPPYTPDKCKYLLLNRTFDKVTQQEDQQWIGLSKCILPGLRP